MVSKKGITPLVVVPTHPGDYIGTTHAQKFKYEKDLRLYLDYKEYICNNVKAFTKTFQKDLFHDLKDSQGLVVGYTPTQMYDHTKDNFLLPRDIAREVNKPKEDFKVVYNPNKIVQTYYKKIKMTIDTLITLNQTVTNGEIMRHVFEAFEQHNDFKEASWEWDRLRPQNQNWDCMRQHFSLEIQGNQIDPSKNKQRGEAKTVIAQIKEKRGTAYSTRIDVGTISESLRLTESTRGSTH